MRLASVSTLSTFTRTIWPTCTASSTFAMRLSAHWEMWTRPSRPGSSSTNAPNVVMRTTLPSTMESTGYFSSATSHGWGCSAFRLSWMRSFSLSTPMILT